MPMNKNLQIHTIKRIIGENSDKVDLNALVDSKIRLNENISNLSQEIAFNNESDYLEVTEDMINDYYSDIEKYQNDVIKMESELQLDRILKRHSIIGIAGSRNTAKSSLILTQLDKIKAKYKNVQIACFGLNPELKTIIESKGMLFLESKMDILDLRLRNTIIYIDEMALFFDVESKNKNLDKLMRFFDRIEHLNDKLIVSTAREGYFTKFMCSRINAFLVKQIEYDSLVNGTWLKERVKAIRSQSDYRLELDKSEYFEVTNTGETATKHTFEYNKEFDTKKNNIDFFG